jgi:hypothetical protein
MHYIRYALFIVTVPIVASACAHTHRATVAMKISPTEAHVGLGSSETSVGDRVAFFKNKCTRPLGGVHQGAHNDPVCDKVKTGDGVITRVLGEQYSIVKANSGAEFDEGTVVERE